MRKRAMNPATLREAFQLIAAADRVLAGVSSAGKQLLNEIGAIGDVPVEKGSAPTPSVSPGRPVDEADEGGGGST
jgi:hypothetical protein